MVDVPSKLNISSICTPPGLAAVRIRGEGVLVTAPCPFCGQQHIHRVGSSTAGDGDGFQVARCEGARFTNRDKSFGYVMTEVDTVANSRKAQRCLGPLCGNEMIWRMDASGGGPLGPSEFSPVMLALLKAWFPGGRAPSGTFAFCDESRGVRFAVLPDGAWVGTFHEQGSHPVRCNGKDLAVLFEAVSGVERGCVALRLLSSALGISLSPAAAARIAAALTIELDQAVCELVTGGDA